MGWHTCEPEDDGHEGYLVAVVDEDGHWRELGYFGKRDEVSRSDIAVVQVGCDCGWRSRRLHTPFGTRYVPYVVVTSEQFEEKCREIWLQHVKSERGTSATIR